MSIKRKKRAVPITPQNELPNGQFSVELFTYLEKKIQVKLSTLLGQAICALTKSILLFLRQKHANLFPFHLAISGPSQCKN